jgi:hypothetical protein
MSFQKILNVLQLIKNYQEIIDIYRLEKYYKTKYKYININNQKGLIENNNNIIFLQPNNQKMIIYKSKIVHKIELSIELLYNIFFKSEKNKDLGKNIFFNFIFELIKCGLKIKEMNSLNKIGIPFYIEENLFYNEFLGISKDKCIDNIINSDINNDINNTILPVQGNLFLPIKEKINNNKYKNLFSNNLILEIKKENKLIKINKKYCIGEIIYLLRPVIYITLLIIFKDNKIIPLIINIILDIIIYFSRLEINKDNYKKFKLNFLLQKINYLEMKFRNKHFFAYIFREPIFSYIIIPLTEKIFNILPIPNFIVRIIMNILDNYSSYTYIA